VQLQDDNAERVARPGEDQVACGVDGQRQSGSADLADGERGKLIAAQVKRGDRAILGVAHQHKRRSHGASLIATPAAGAASRRDCLPPGRLLVVTA